ncbi:ankyrin repeat protein [Colletotrichum kahawae]|uniref:Ankyrin repeat protein n=1 Tax=Colletotrichum kahawae TaxID=34407 RepID=A0AAD9YYJ0_COLKA|nr:ankyrin repeat protein [Colletotrichum kahawae]
MTPPNFQSPTPPNLQCLPTELLLLIVAGVGKDLRRTVLAGLSRTNKSLHATCNPMLYDDAIKQNAPEITTLAARDGNLETLTKAREYGADLNVVTWVPFPSWAQAKDAHGEDAAPLAMAACEEHYHVVKYLMSLRVDVDVPGKLFCKCHATNGIFQYGWPRESYGPSWLMTICHAGVWTPLHYALCRKKTSIARLLISYGASLTNTRYPVRSQIPRGNGIASLFGLDAFGIDKQGAATIRKRLGPLIRSLGLLETVQAEDTDTETENEDSESDPDMLDGSDADNWDETNSEIRDDHGDYDAGEIGYAIHTAAVMRNETIIRCLVLDHNIDINQMDREGATALHYALKTESVQMVRCVLSLGANPNVPFDKFENTAEWALSLNDSRNWVNSYLDRAMQALLDSGVSLWTQRRNAKAQPGEKSMMINQCADSLSRCRLSYSYDGWFRSFLLGSIAEYDENQHRKLKREKMDLFWSVLLNRQISASDLGMIVNLIGPIDFTELVSDDTAPPGHHMVSAGVTIGEQAFRSLEGVVSWVVSTEERHSTLERIEWISEQGAPLSHKTLRFITGIIKKEPGYSDHWWPN